MRKIALATMVLMVALCVACATTKPFNQWSPKEKATWFLGLYNAEFDDYQLQASSPNLTDAQKNILRTKKQILTQVYPMIGTYASLTNSGGVPSPELELQIMQLLNQLAAKATAK